jgi:hypothetical protein
MPDWSVITNSWGIAFIGGLVGAAGGALGAQAIAEQTAARRERLAQFRNINALIQLSFSACNSAIVFRKQFSKNLFEELAQQRSDIEITLRTQLQDGDKPYLQMNLLKFPAPILPIEMIREILFSKVAIVGRELSAMNEIASALHGLTDALRRREEFIDEIAGGKVNQTDAAMRYLGISKPDGRPGDNTYFSTVESIESYAKDLAFFSHLLCNDLIEHGLMIHKLLAKRRWLPSRKDVPAVSKIDFSAAARSGLLPSEIDYESWLKGFVKAGAATK